MVYLTFKEIGLKLKQAGRLSTTPLCVYGLDTNPENGVSIKNLNRCIANAIFNLSIKDDNNLMYIGNNSSDDCCPGGKAWLGYISFNPQLKYFLSTGKKDFRRGASEFLLANPDLAEKQLNSVGKITPIGKYTVIQKSDSIDKENIRVKSYLCFGSSEQIRNLCSLAYFQPEVNFIAIVPWGPSCASFITFPAELVNQYKNSLIVGPTDPTGNCWFPPDFLSLGIPVKIAERMAKTLDESFIMKRPRVAYPIERKR